MVDSTVAAARLLSCHKAPYLARALFGLTLEACRLPAEGMICVTADYRCYYDTDRLKQRQVWNPKMLGGLLVHEIWHILRGHFPRTPREVREITQGWRDRKLRWNIACDLAINGDMRAQGFTLPAWGYFPEDLGLEAHQTAEWYYERIKDDPNLSPLLDQTAAELHLTREELERLIMDLQNSEGITLKQKAIAQAVAEQLQTYRQQGCGSQEMDRFMQEALQPPKHRWEDELRHGLRGALQRGDQDYSWRRCNRRRQESDILFPGLATYRPSVVVVEDTSGSMGKPELQLARSETAAMLTTLQVGVRVLCCDSEAKTVQTVYRIRNLKLIGGGGTDMGEGLRAAGALVPRPDLIVVMTDGYTDWPDKAPLGCKVLTVLVGAGTGPGFGKTVRIT